PHSYLRRSNGGGILRGIHPVSTARLFLERIEAMSAAVPILLMARELGLGGTERQLTEIARTIDREQFAPHVGCLHAEGLRGAELEAAGVPIARFAVRSLYRPSTIRAAREMGRYLKQHRIQLVHTYDVPMNLFG